MTVIAMLKVEDIHTYYGSSHILFGVSLDVPEGRAIALLGRNGAGKTTTLRSILGLTSPRKGKVHFLGTEITRMPVHRIARMGMGYVPENRMIFPDLTVWENLSLGVCPQRQGKWSLETAYKIFPVLEKMKYRPAGMTSGGEQQMLTIARSIMMNPVMLLLDEPLEGLSPVVVQVLKRTIRYLKDEGLNIMLCEHNVAFALDLCDWIYIIEKGNIRFQGPAQVFEKNPEIREKYLVVRGRARDKDKPPRTS